MQGLGFRIRELRKTRRMTLVEVATKTGIDQATLSRIENGVMVGTLSSHMKIADVLGVPLPQLYDDVIKKIHEVKDTEIKEKLESFSHSSGVIAELLTSSVLQKKMMPILLKMKPKAETQTESFPPLTERFVYVFKGTVDVTLGKETRELGQGEGFYFDASIPHRLTNSSKNETFCISVMSPASL